MILFTAGAAEEFPFVLVAYARIEENRGTQRKDHIIIALQLLRFVT